MQELRALLAHASRLVDSRQGGALVTLCRVEGSSYRRVGSQAVIEPPATMSGVLTGGCLERDLFELARQCLGKGAPRLAEFDLRPAADRLWGSGTGCPGKLCFLAEPLGLASTRVELEHWRVLLEEDREVRSILLYRSSRPTEPWIPGARWGLLPGTDRAIPPGLHPALALLQDLEPGKAASFELELKGVGPVSCLLSSRLPPPRLVLLGAGRDLLPLARLASELGWKLVVADPRPTPERSERFEGLATYIEARPGRLGEEVPLGRRTAVLVATHHFLDDLAHLPELLEAPLGYLGLLGSRHRSEELLAALASAPGKEPLRNRFQVLSTPAGLDLGGEGPEAVALSILAEAHARLHGASAGSLSERAPLPRHDPDGAP